MLPVIVGRSDVQEDCPAWPDTTSVNWCDVIDIQFGSDFDFLHKLQPRLETDKLGSVRTACPVNDRRVAE